MNFCPIGIIYTSHKTKDECPIWPTYSADAAGRVEAYGEYAAGLKDIETFLQYFL